MYHLVESLRRIAILIYPFMKDTSINMFNQLGIIDESLKSWDSLSKYDGLNNIKVIESAGFTEEELSLIDEVSVEKKA